MGAIMKNWIDVTMGIFPEMMVYKNKDEKKPKFTVRATHEANGHYESSIYMDLHTGTHIDMPLHMIENGTNSDHFDLDLVNGICTVLDFSKEERHEVDEAFLSQFEINKGDIIIIKTKNAYDTIFNLEYDYLDASGATYLQSKGIKTVGIDALGIERSQAGHPTHSILLGNDIYIIEGLALKTIEAGKYELRCLPLKILGVEGLPARALMRKVD